MKRFYLPLVLLVVFQAFFYGQANAQLGGTSTYAFLDLPISAREAALGGSLICVKDGDLNLGFNTPSLLDSTTNNHLALSYIGYFAGIKYGYAGYGRTFRNIGTFDAGIKYINYGDFTAADATGIVTGTFKAYEELLTIGYGRQLNKYFSVGANLKTIYSALDQYFSSGSAFDVAATYYNPKRRFTATALIQNMGWQWKSYTVGDHEPLPFDMQLGISKRLKHAPFRFSVTADHLQKLNLTYSDPLDTVGQTKQPSKLSKFGDKTMRHIVLGGEVLITKNFNLRIGYNYERRKELEVSTRPAMVGFSWGFGFKISKFCLSYGRATYHLAGASNHFTITTNLSEFYSKDKK